MGKLTGQTGARGFGVFAGENISGGDFVMDYRGEVSFAHDLQRELRLITQIIDMK